MKDKIKNGMVVMCVATSALALSCLLVGCDQDKAVSKTESSSVGSDGTVKSKEKTVTQTPDGAVVTKTEESKSTVSTNKP